MPGIKTGALGVLLPGLMFMAAFPFAHVAAQESQQMLVCSDYRPSQEANTSACMGRPRGWTPQAAEGATCYAYSPAKGNSCGVPSGYACNPALQQRTVPPTGAYSSAAPMASYRQGGSVCLQWLRRGPGGAGGTATIFGCPARETRDVSQAYLQSCRGGRCLATLSLNSSCTTRTESAGDQHCSGCFTLPPDLALGLYTFQWLASPDSSGDSSWASTCWDALITPGSEGSNASTASSAGVAAAACSAGQPGWQAAWLKAASGATPLACPSGLQGQTCQILSAPLPQQPKQPAAAGQCIVHNGVELQGSGLGEATARSADDCCSRCKAATQCNLWVWCGTAAQDGGDDAPNNGPSTEAGGCVLASGSQLASGACLLMRCTEVEAAQPPRVAALGSGVRVISGSPLPQAVLAAPEVPGYALLRGREVKDLYDYQCEGSLVGAECKHAGQPADLAARCNTDPRCRGFTFFPEGSGADPAPLAFFKGGAASRIDPSAGNSNPRAALYVKQ